MGPRAIFVDGYNVIRNTPGLAQADRANLAAGRVALIERLTARYRHTPHRVVIVFDGDGACERVLPMRGVSRGQVVFTCAGETADAAIARMVAFETSEAVTVVSNDLEVRLNADAQGADVVQVGELARHMNSAPRHLMQRHQHRAYMQQMLDAEADEDTPAAHARSGNPHKAPRRNRRRNGQPDRRL
ncbi:MAG: NYN domain-containing protein [Ktedonobacterales bacterium]